LCTRRCSYSNDASDFAELYWGTGSPKDKDRDSIQCMLHYDNKLADTVRPIDLPDYFRWHGFYITVLHNEY